MKDNIRDDALKILKGRDTKNNIANYIEVANGYGKDTEGFKRYVKGKDKKTIKGIKKVKNKKTVRRGIKAALAATLVAIGMGTAAAKVIIDKLERAGIAEQVAGLSTEEIKENIDKILKQEISDSTGIDTEKIYVSFRNVSSGATAVTFSCDGKNYTGYDNFMSIANPGDLKKGKIVNAAFKSDRATNEKEMTEAYVDMVKATEKNNLKVVGDKMQEVNDDGEER